MFLRTEDALYNLALIKRIRVKVDGNKATINLDGEIEEIEVQEEDAKYFKETFLDLVSMVMTGFAGKPLIDLRRYKNLDDGLEDLLFDC